MLTVYMHVCIPFARLKALWSEESPVDEQSSSIAFYNHGWWCIYWAQELDWGQVPRGNRGSSQGIAARSALQDLGPQWTKIRHAQALWIAVASPWLPRTTRACWINQARQSLRVRWPRSMSEANPMEVPIRATMATATIPSRSWMAWSALEWVASWFTTHTRSMTSFSSFAKASTLSSCDAIQARSRQTAVTNRSLMMACVLWGRWASRFGHPLMSWRRWEPRMPCARWLPWTLVSQTLWPTTALRSSPLASRRPWRSSHVSSSRIVAHLARAFGSSNWRWELLQGVRREVLWGWWEAGPHGGQWQPWGRAHGGRVCWILCSWPYGQVRWVDLQRCRQVLGGWQGGRWPACGSALLPTYCGRRTALQSHRWFFDWSHSQEAQGGRNLCRWWNWFHLHLLRTGGATFRKFDRELLEERLAPCDAFPGLGRWAVATLVDHWLHQRLASRNQGWGWEVDCGRVQLLLRGDLPLLGCLLQGRHPQRLLGWHLRGRQGRGKEDGRPHGRKGVGHSLKVRGFSQLHTITFADGTTALSV